MTNMLVVPKFSSRQTKGKHVDLQPSEPLTAMALVAGSMRIKLNSDLSAHTDVRLWLTPHGGVHAIKSSPDPSDTLLWRQELDSADYPGFVVWQGQTSGRELRLREGLPVKFGMYSRRPAFNERGAQIGYRWSFYDAGVFICRSEQDELAIASEVLTVGGQITFEQREKHVIDVLSAQRQLAEAARNGFNQECSDVLSESLDEWRLQFLSGRHMYKNDTLFTAQCRRLHWSRALQRVGQPWQLAVALRECLRHFMAENNLSDQHEAAHRMINAFVQSSPNHPASAQFEHWFSNFCRYLDW